MDQDPDTGEAVLVTGATGDIGGEVVRLLTRAGVRVRAMHRRPEQAAALLSAGAAPVRAAFGDERALRAALDGVGRVLLLTPPVPEQWAFEQQVIDLAAEDAGRHVVRISAADSSLRTPVPWARTHARADHRLAASGASWTVLRPTAFMQDFAQQAATIRHGLLPHTAGDGEVSWVDTRDVAAVAARVLTSEVRLHAGATYFLSGPEPLSFPAVASRMRRVLRRRVRAVQLPKRVYARLLRLGGQDAFTADGLAAQFGIVVRSGLDIDTTHEVERLTGGPAGSIDQWIDDHRRLLLTR